MFKCPCCNRLATNPMRRGASAPERLPRLLYSYCERYCCDNGKGKSFDIENGYVTEYCACEIRRREDAFLKLHIQEAK